MIDFAPENVGDIDQRKRTSLTDPGARLRRRVLVTGASGFVGRAVLALKSPGQEWIAVSRRRAEAKGIQWRIGPALSAQADWKPLLEEVDDVIHLAGRVHRPSDSDAAVYAEENSEGTIKLAHDAIDTGVRRFIFLSTAKVLGDESGSKALDELYVPRPLDAYAESKLAAERALSGMRNRLEITVLRPPLVYGPGVRANFLALLMAVERGLPMPLASIENRRSLVGVRNLASAIVACLDSPAAAGRTFHVTDGTAQSTPGLVRSIATAVGGHARLFSFPPPLLEAIGTALGRGEYVRRLTRSLELDDRAIRETLAWRPVHTLEQGLAETANWFRAR